MKNAPLTNARAIPANVLIIARCLVRTALIHKANRDKHAKYSALWQCYEQSRHCFVLAAQTAIFFAHRN